MKDERKTKAELIKELGKLRQQNSQLQKSTQSVTNKEKAAKNGEKYFESLFENAPLGYQSLDENGNFLEVNEAWCKTLGYEKNEVIGRNFAEFIHPDFKEHFKKNFPQFKKLGQILGVEFEMIKKDGTEIIVSINGKIGYHPNQTFKQTHCLLHDITERKDIEEALRESEEFNRTIIENSPLGISVRSARGKLLNVNKAWQAIWNLSDEQLKKYLDKNPEKLDFATSNKWLGNWQPKVQKIYKVGGYLYIPELLYKHDQNDRERWISLTYYAILDFEKKVDRVVILTEDITDRKQTEQKIIEANAQLKGIFNSTSTIGFVEVGDDGIITLFSRGAEEMLGYRAKDVIGKMTPIAFHLESEIKQFSEKVSLDIGRAVTGMEAFFEAAILYGEGPFEWTWVRKDGSHLKVLLTSAFILDPDEKIIGRLGIIQDITDRKQVEEELQTRESQLAESQTVACIGSWTWDLVTNKVIWSDELHRLFGISREELGSQYESYMDFVHPDDKKPADDLVKDAIGAGRDFRFDARIVRFDGSIWVMNSIGKVMARDESGKPLVYSGTAQDITERKRAEEDLKERKQFIESIVNLSPDILYIYDIIEKKNIYSNDGIEIILGYSADEIKDMGDQVISNLMHPDDFKKYVAETFPKYATAENGDLIKHEFRMKHKNGQWHWFDCSEIIYLRTSSCLPKQILGVMHDITERKQAEEALIESEKKFRLIAERTFDVIVMVEMDGTITYVSPSIERVFGHMPKDLIGKKVMNFVPESAIPEVIRTLKQSAAGNLVEPEFSKFEKADGSIADIEINAIPIYKEDQVIGAQAIIRDISETKRLQEQESRAQRLESAGRVAGQIAHDFNNLLAPLVAYPDFIKEGLPENHPTLKYINDMEKSANQIAEINQQLLTLSRRGHYNQEALNLNDVIQFAIGEMGILPQALVIQTDFANNLMNVRGGAAQIHRVLSNLIYNARDAMLDVGNIIIKTENYYADNLTINYGHIPKGEYIKVTISDIGGGIPKDIQHNIFDPFFTTKSSDRRRGSGLGLSVVDAVMKDHEGFIDLKSKVGEGTSFYLYFPITRGNIKTSDDNEIFGGTESILVIDDDEVQCNVALKLLKKLGYNATAVNSGEKAIKYLKENPQDLLLIDMIMPNGIDGTETFKRVLDIYPAQKAIIVSGYAESSRVEEARQLGIDIYIRKPLTLRLLAPYLRRVLDKKEASARTV